MATSRKTGRSQVLRERTVNIFLTVGSMLPFDRLVRAVDNWAERQGDHQIFAQIGESDYKPANFEYHSKISPAEFRGHCGKCDLIISHVGMGTVITALECNKPLIALPRRQELKEVTSTHQLATANWLEDRPSIYIIYNEDEIDFAVSKMALFAGKVGSVNTESKVELEHAIRQFIQANTRN